MNKFLFIFFSNFHVLSTPNQDKNKKQMPLKLKGILSVLCENHVFTPQDVFNYKFGLIFSEDCEYSASVGFILKKKACHFHCAMILKKEECPTLLIGFYPKNFALSCFGLSFYLSKASLGVTLNLRHSIDCFVLDLGTGSSYNLDPKKKEDDQGTTGPSNSQGKQDSNHNNIKQTENNAHQNIRLQKDSTHQNNDHDNTEPTISDPSELNGAYDSLDINILETANKTDGEILALFRQEAQTNKASLTKFLVQYNLKNTEFLCKNMVFLNNSIVEKLSLVYLDYLAFKQGHSEPETREKQREECPFTPKHLFAYQCSSMILGLINKDNTWKDKNGKQCIVLNASETDKPDILGALYRLCFDNVIIPYHCVPKVVETDSGGLNTKGHFTVRIYSQNNQSNKPYILDSAAIQGDDFSCGYFAAAYCFLLKKGCSKEDLKEAEVETLLGLLLQHINKVQPATEEAKKLIGYYKKNKKSFKSGQRIATLVRILYFVKNIRTDERIRTDKDIEDYKNKILGYMNQYKKENLPNKKNH